MLAKPRARARCPSQRVKNVLPAPYSPRIERKHDVGRRTIVKALDSADPPARKKVHREPAALKGLHPQIDSMIKANPAIPTAAIWQRLADDRGVTVAYPTLRTYVTIRRTLGSHPGSIL